MIRQLRPRGYSRCLRGVLLRGSLACAAAVATTVASWCLAAPSWAAASSISVRLSPNSIAADDASTTQVVATVQDGSTPVTDDVVSFASNDGNETIGPVTNNGDGTYSATITSATTTAVQSTITATDSLGLTAATTLTQHGPAASISLSLSPSASLPADGSSSSTLIATATDANGYPVGGEHLNFSSSDPGEKVGPVTDNGDGTYTATVTSSTTVGTATITADDPSAGLPNAQATLTQTPGPASSVTVELSPASIVANGTSQSVATATLTDARGNPIAGDHVSFSSSDGGETIGPVTDHNNGTYTATVTSSTVAQPVTITATDSSVSPNVSGHATLTQTPVQSATALIASPDSVVANQTVTLSATVSANTTALWAGTVTFEDGGVPIPNCSGETLSSSTATVTCSTSFAAGAPSQLIAVFTPGAGVGITGSSGTAAITASQDPTVTTLHAASSTLGVGARETYVAVVAPAYTGPLGPSGSVSFLDGGKPIGSCTGRSLTAASGSDTASCTLTYPARGSHTITAVYSGDANFGGSSSGPAVVRAVPRPRLGVTMRWSFVSGPAYTKVLTLLVRGVAAGSEVLVTCHGGGCPFTTSALGVPSADHCSAQAKDGCSATTVDLTSRFAGRALRPGAKITVQIVRSGWIGRAYTFVIRAHRPPRTATAWVA
jgi:Invasin, domain 3/Bacterial Ig-like domain (group 3)